jgi:asparagine synthase (glutamine-hydrolysing)
MCGIVGWVNGPLIDSKNLMTSIAHRGPDDFGIVQYQNLVLGHTRLSIQDLSKAGHQPMQSADGRFEIIFNGEIYNHWEIRAQLKTTTFRSSSDTETLLVGFIELGAGILDLLNGIFAFSIIDKKTNQLFIARDQFGIKPLYYYQKGDQFAFGSEIKSFLASPQLDKTIDCGAIFNYTSYLWSPGEKTAFEHVKKLLPGHYINIDLTTPNLEIKPIRYYQLKFEGNYFNSNESELAELLKNKLKNAVKRQLLADVPVGFFLSGGLDSSALVAMARELMPNEKIQCFTIDTGELEETEGFKGDLVYAQEVARYLNVDLEIVKADLNILEDFDRMIWHLDEPQADLAPLNVLNICKRAKEMGYKVLISGAGGDDLFSGYRRHQALRYENIIHYLPRPIRHLIKGVVGLLTSKGAFVRRLRKLTAGFDMSTKDRILNYFAWVPKKTILNLFNYENQQNLVNHEPFKFFKARWNEVKDKSRLNKLLFVELNTFLVDHNLNYTDKMGMAEGVEIRVPFLDKDLVEFSTKINPLLKLKGNETKYILKKAMEDYLPKEVIYRPKTGFGAPVRQWITNDMDDRLSDIFNESKIEEMSIFDHDEIWKLIKLNKRGKIDGSYTILSLLAIESWMRQFVDYK